jgi:hypothetical protein
MTASSSVLGAGMARAGWDAVDLWRAALAVGGGFTRQDLESILVGTRLATSAEHDVLVATLNDHFIEQGGGIARVLERARPLIDSR